MCECRSTILEEEKLQEEERHRMEMRRQVNMSWDSGGSDEAPPKVRFHPWLDSLLFDVVGLKQSVCCASAAQQTRLPQPSIQRRLLLQPTAQPFPGTDAPLCRSSVLFQSLKGFFLTIRRFLCFYNSQRQRLRWIRCYSIIRFYHFTLCFLSQDCSFGKLCFL